MQIGRVANASGVTPKMILHDETIGLVPTAEGMVEVAELEARTDRRREMARVLHRLADACDGDGRPECPILEGLEGRATP